MSVRRRHLLIVTAAAVTVLMGGCSGLGEPSGPGGPESSAPTVAVPAHPPLQGRVTPPPAGAAFDYQIGGPYPPAADVRVVIRDHGATPAAGRYTICYLNAFQAQPGAEAEWDQDLLLRSPDGTAVVDTYWGETLLDLRTAEKRERIAIRVGAWIDDCAAKGFQAIEPDNYDSYTRSQGLLGDADAQAFIRLLAAHAHARGLAVAQKNTAELSARRRDNGLDFAVVEECGEQDNCGDYTASFGNRVIVIEYDDEGFANACRQWGARLSVVRRDRGVVPIGSDGYVRRTC